MKCQEMNELLAEYWSQELSDAKELEFQGHLQSCPECHAQFSRLDGLWRNLPGVPAEEPSEALRIRFYEALGAYRQGAEAASHPTNKQSWWQRLLSFQQPAWGLAMAGGLLVLGLGAGYALKPDTSHSEIAELHQEVTSMRQMIALSLLQQQSASERLRGVSYAYRSEPSNKEVLSALVSAVNDDPNVNVRLAAVDALHAFAASPSTRQAAMASLPHQDTPLVQVALIDLLVDMKEQKASGELRRLASDESVNDGVKQRALWALGRLQQ
jgi:HEAT repeats/Putative zinc-finger